MKVWVNGEEWFPVYTPENLDIKRSELDDLSFVEKSYPTEIFEIDEARYEQMKKVFNDFIQLQKELASLVNELPFTSADEI